VTEPKKPEPQAEDDGHELPVRRRRGEEDHQAGRRGLLVLIPVVMIGAAIVFFVLEGMKDQAIYEKPVDQLVANHTHFAGRPVRAEGKLVHGTITKRDQPCEYRFVIEKNGTQMPVRFPQCVVPDTFRDVAGMDVPVTVEGELQPDDSFVATAVLAKCPSKYQEKADRGEKMPHQVIEPGNM
jgi:cytochrome c-type biogenesis protein CcmE